MPYVTERWPGGMLTNFPTIRKAVKKMSTIDKMATDGTFDTLSKRERLQVARQRAKLEKNLGSIVDLTRLPAAMFVVDVVKENIAVREATRLNIPVFAIVDTNSNPNLVDFPIPANDDASKSIDLIVSYLAEAIEEGLSERKLEKDKETTAKDKKVKDAKDAKEAKEAAAVKKLKRDEDEDEDEDDEDGDDEEGEDGDEVQKSKPLSLQGIVDDEDEVKVVTEVKKPRIVKKVVRKKED
jgi:small subunit ribosomal protein S2